MAIHIVLVEPEIPQNTGSIGRLCLATRSILHLVEPLGFDISDSRLKRAGLDYWQYLHVIRHPNLEDLIQQIPVTAQKIFFSSKVKTTLFEVAFQPETYLFFGKETKGLSSALLETNTSATIPIFDARARSLNLAQAVGIAVYEALRQLQVTA
jgi:tRNA (cytidine/uridine-2'-O-)-methyltransferase